MPITRTPSGQVNVPDPSKVLPGVPKRNDPDIRGFWKQVSDYRDKLTETIPKRDRELVSHGFRIAEHLCSLMEKSVSDLEDSTLARPTTREAVEEHHAAVLAKVGKILPADANTENTSKLNHQVLPDRVQDGHFQDLAENVLAHSDDHHAAALAMVREQQYILQLAESICHNARGRFQDVARRSGGSVPGLGGIINQAAQSAAMYASWIKSREFRDNAVEEQWQGHLYVHIAGAGFLLAACDTMTEVLLHVLFLTDRQHMDSCIALFWRLSTLGDGLMWALAAKDQKRRLHTGMFTSAHRYLSSFWIVELFPTDMVLAILQELREGFFVIMFMIPQHISIFRNYWSEQSAWKEELRGIEAAEATTNIEERRANVTAAQAKAKQENMRLRTLVEKGRVQEAKQELRQLILQEAREQMRAEAAHLERQQGQTGYPLLSSNFQAQLDGVAAHFGQRAGGQHVFGAGGGAGGAIGPGAHLGM